MQGQKERTELEKKFDEYNERKTRELLEIKPRITLTRLDNGEIELKVLYDHRGTSKQWLKDDWRIVECYDKYGEVKVIYDKEIFKPLEFGDDIVDPDFFKNTKVECKFYHLESMLRYKPNEGDVLCTHKIYPDSGTGFYRYQDGLLHRIIPDEDVLEMIREDDYIKNKTFDELYNIVEFGEDYTKEDVSNIDPQFSLSQRSAFVDMDHLSKYVGRQSEICYIVGSGNTATYIYDKKKWHKITE